MSDNAQRKRRPDAWEKIAQLSDEQIWKAFAWSQAFGYRKAARMIEAEFHIPAPGTTAMGEFYEYYLIEERASRIHKSVADAASIRALAEQEGSTGNDLAAVLEKEAGAAILAGDDAGRIRLLVSLAIKARGSLRSEKTLDLEIRKYQDAVKSNIERGLDALADEIKDNPDATALYIRIREIVMASMTPRNAVEQVKPT